MINIKDVDMEMFNRFVSDSILTTKEHYVNILHNNIYPNESTADIRSLVNEMYIEYTNKRENK